MAENKPEESKTRKGLIMRVLSSWLGRGFTKIFDVTLGQGGEGEMPYESFKTGEPEEIPVEKQFTYEFSKNQGMISKVGEIEDRWDQLEFNDGKGLIFPYHGKKVQYEKEPHSNTITDLYRLIEYYRDFDITNDQSKLLEQTGTMMIIDKKTAYERERILQAERNAVIAAEQAQMEIQQLEAIDPKTKEQNDRLEDARTRLANAQSARGKMRDLISHLEILPELKINKIQFPILDGKTEEFIVFGVVNIGPIQGRFDELSKHLDNFASANGVTAGTRTPVTRLFAQIKDNLGAIKKIEEQQFHKIEHIKSGLDSTNRLVTAAESIRPDIDKIRFCHTYKIIRQVRSVKDDRTGNRQTFYFKDDSKYSGNKFKRKEEQSPGLDENGWPLEVDPNTGEVLLDRWWKEIGKNEWQLRTIANKTGGPEVLKQELGIDVIKRKGNIISFSGTPNRTVRIIPPEWIGDLDPLDHMMFIENEWDSFRDDFRDGRFHPHSKTSMDYIIAGTKGITPSLQINYPINTPDHKVRINFRPIYNTDADKPIGEDEGKGIIVGEIRSDITTEQIPEDERKVTRIYDLELCDSENPKKVKTLKWQVRKPTPFDPAFDRAALPLPSDFVHWGRMLYYETTDGINRWSENPFPHITSRGIAKYLIDLTIRRTFSFEHARNTLKGKEWDFGVRHYGRPFITDPLGPAKGQGGALAGAIKSEGH